MTSPAGLDDDFSGQPQDYQITIKKNTQTVKQFDIPINQAYILLDVFKSQQSFQRGFNTGLQQKGWTFEVETDAQVQEIVTFITTGVRSLMPSGSQTLQGTGIDIVTGLMEIKPDYRYPDYLTESGLQHFREIWEQEYQTRKQFANLAREHGPYESEDKINGQISGHVFDYGKIERVKDEKYNRNVLHVDYVDRNDVNKGLQYDLASASAESLKPVKGWLGRHPKLNDVFETPDTAYTNFSSRISEQHRHLFTTHPLAKKFCVSGDSVFLSIVGRTWNRPIDIFPLVSKHTEEFVEEFAKEVQKTGFVELSRTKNTIDVVWYPNPDILLRKIFFPWMTEDKIGKDLEKIFKDNAFREGILVHGEHAELHRKIVREGIEKTYTRGWRERYISEILATYGDVIDGADLPTAIRENLKEYHRKYVNDPGFSERVSSSVVRKFEEGKIIYRINLQRNSSVHEVLCRMDVDCNCFAIYMKKIYLTRRGHHALVSGMNIVDPTRQSSNYYDRLIRYKIINYEILVPSLEANKIIFHNNMDDTIGLSRLILMIWKGKTEKKLPGLTRSYVNRIISYNIESIIGKIATGWLESGYKTRCRFPGKLIIDDVTSELIGNIDTIRTPFYFSAYITLFDLIRYRSKINYVDNTILKIRNYPPRKDITVDVDVPIISNDLIEQYIQIRSNRNVYEEKYEVEEHGEQPEQDRLKGSIVNHFPLDHLRFFKTLIENLRDCLVLLGNDSHLEGRVYRINILFDVHPIVQTGGEFISFIKRTSQILEEKFSVIMYKRSEKWLEIFLSKRNKTFNVGDMLRLLRSFVSLRDDRSFDELIHRLKTSRNRTMNRNMLLEIHSMAKQIITDNSYRRLPLIEQKGYITAVDNLTLMLDVQQESYELYGGTTAIFVVRINYTASSELADAFTFINHANECIGWHNGLTVYNDRFKLYAETGKIVLDPAFRQNDMFERVRNDLHTVVLPYERTKINQWVDMDIRGNLHDFLMMTTSGDENWLDNSGVTPYTEHRMEISFTSPDMITTVIVTTPVGTFPTRSGNPRPYTLNFDNYAVKKAKPVGDFHEALVKYGRMAFLNRKQAIKAISRKFAHMGDDRIELTCSI